MNYPPLGNLMNSTVLSIFSPGIQLKNVTAYGPSSSTGVACPAGAKGEAVVLFQAIHATAATPCTLDAQVMESTSTDGTYTNITGAAITQIPKTKSLTSTQKIVIPLEGRKRYFRLKVVTGASGTGSSKFGAVICFGGRPNS